MPLYSLKCLKCQKQFEAIIPLADYPNKVKCQYCGETLVRLMDAPMFRIK